MLFARGTSISFKQWRQSGANLGLWRSLKYNYRGALWVRPQKVEVCVCLLESKTNPIHESALSCFLLFLDHFTVLNKRTTFFKPITGKMQFCPVLIKVGRNTTGNVICYITQRRPQHTIAAISKKPLHKGLPLDLFQLYIYSVLSSPLQIKSNFVSWMHESV